MIKNYKTFFLGLFIVIIPAIGLPVSKTTLFVLSGLLLIIFSVKINLPKRGAVKRIRRKEKVTPVFVENSPMPNQEDNTVL